MKRGHVDSDRTTHGVCEKRRIYMNTDLYTCEQRRICEKRRMHIKRNVYMCKQNCVHEKRLPGYGTWEETCTMSNEAYLCKKCYVYDKGPVYVKRDLDV